MPSCRLAPNHAIDSASSSPRSGRRKSKDEVKTMSAKYSTQLNDSAPSSPRSGRRKSKEEVKNMSPIQLNGVNPSTPRSVSARRRSQGDVNSTSGKGRRSSTGDIKSSSKIQVRPRDDNFLPLVRQKSHGHLVKHEADGNRVEYVIDKQFKDFERNLVTSAAPILKSKPGECIYGVWTWLGLYERVVGPDAASLRQTRPRKPIKIDVNRMVPQHLPYPSPRPSYLSHINRPSLRIILWWEIVSMLLISLA